MYLAREYKRSELAFNSFRQLKIQYPSINLVVFGLEPLVSVVGLPNSEQYISKPNQNELRMVTMLKTSIKGSGDVALYLHHKEIVRGRSIIISQASFLRK